MKTSHVLFLVIVSLTMVTGAVAQTPGDLVINEFMAQNDSIPDPASEYDDWIEIHNNTAKAIDLTGMYLTDDPVTPKKWAFPSSTTIDSSGYLIVWADQDSTQAGLHANFVLPIGGGYLQCTNSNGNTLDSVTYGVQIANRSMARIPNGTGPFFTARSTFGANNANSAVSNPSLASYIVPQVIEGINGTNASRIPFAYRATFKGLLPRATYRFMNQIVISSDAASTSGSGNCIFVPSSGDFTRTSSPGLATAGAYGSFISDSTGSYAGWFVTEPTGNTRFVPGKFIFMRIGLNDGASGTSVSARLTIPDSVRVVKLDAALSDSTGSGLRCTSNGSPKDFVFLYDNTSGSGRPVTGSFIESDGTDNSTSNNYASFYATAVNGIAGAFGVVIPNTLANGIRRVEQRTCRTGNIHTFATDADGIWPSGVVTVNPSGGSTPLVLASTDVGLTTLVRQSDATPAEYTLSQNYPNPFNPSCKIGFGVSGLGSRWIRLSVYDILGREVAVLVDQRKEPGFHEVTFDGHGLSSGVYFYRLTAGDFTRTERMLLVR
jgi:hypothetical protein